MTDTNNKPQSWKQKVVKADNIWSQIQEALKVHGLELPKTPRCPDMRLILKNISGQTMIFKNPGDHSSKAETIPSSGEKTAAMIMLLGNSIGEQRWAARELCKKYNLLNEGLSPELIQAIADRNEPLVKEAYGPAPFEEQASRLVNFTWRAMDRSDLIEPEGNDVCAYGARAPEKEQAVRTEFAIMVQGTGTNPEFIENEGIVIAISEDWQTKEVSSRPIVPSVAKEFYGKHYESMPIAKVNPEGLVHNIQLGEDQIIHIDPPKEWAEEMNIA